MERVRGRRFDDEPRLNMKKVVATIVAIVVLVMVVISIKNLFTKEKNVNVMSIPTAYFTVYENGKYGVIDSKGNEVIRPSYEEMIVIPNKTKDLFICAYEVDYNNGNYKTRVLNSSGKEILTNYSEVQAIENKTENDIWYEDNVLIYKKDGLYGLINFSGNKITEPEYTNIYALDGVEKNIIIEKNDLKGIVNSSLEKVVLECNYNNISVVSGDTSDNGYIINTNGKYGVVSASGKVVLECNYDEIKNVTGSNMYVVNDGTGFKVIDNNLNVILDGGFDDIKSIDGENIIIQKSGVYGVVNKNNETKIPVEYEDLKYSFDSYYIAKKGGLYGIVSLDNVVCLDFAYNSMDYIKSTNFYQAENSDFTTNVINKSFETKLSNIIISELNLEKDYMRVRENGDYKYYNFNFEEKTNIEVLKSNTLFLSRKDGKYGYVNNNGELIVNPIYDDAKEQNEFGYCVVKKDGVWGVLASDGRVILEPSVNLDDSLYIDFIASWHLYNDTDLNIYVK